MSGFLWTITSDTPRLCMSGYLCSTGTNTTSGSSQIMSEFPSFSQRGSRSACVTSFTWLHSRCGSSSRLCCGLRVGQACLQLCQNLLLPLFSLFWVLSDGLQLAFFHLQQTREGHKSNSFQAESALPFFDLSGVLYATASSALDVALTKVALTLLRHLKSSQIVAHYGCLRHNRTICWMCHMVSSGPGRMNVNTSFGVWTIFAWLIWRHQLEALPCLDGTSISCRRAAVVSQMLRRCCLRGSCA